MYGKQSVLATLPNFAFSLFHLYLYIYSLCKSNNYSLKSAQRKSVIILLVLLYWNCPSNNVKLSF